MDSQKRGPKTGSKKALLSKIEHLETILFTKEAKALSITGTSTSSSTPSPPSLLSELNLVPTPGSISSNSTQVISENQFFNNVPFMDFNNDRFNNERDNFIYSNFNQNNNFHNGVNNFNTIQQQNIRQQQAGQQLTNSLLSTSPQFIDKNIINLVTNQYSNNSSNFINFEFQDDIFFTNNNNADSNYFNSFLPAINSEQFFSINYTDTNANYNPLFNLPSTSQQKKQTEPKIHRALFMQNLRRYKTAISLLPWINYQDFLRRLNAGSSDEFMSIQAAPLPQYMLDIIYAYNIIREKEHLGESSFYVAADIYAQKSIAALKELKHSETIQADALQTKMFIAVYYLFIGKQDKGSQYLTQIFQAAQSYHWDRPSCIEAQNKLQKRYSSTKKNRMVIWANLLSFSTFCTRPILGNEMDHFWMMDELEWMKVGIPNEDDGRWDERQNATRIATQMQIIFLYRKVIRFCYQQPPPTQIVNYTVFSAFPTPNVKQLHDSLITWYENIPPVFKMFDNLTDFIQGIRPVQKKTWIVRYCNMHIHFLWILSLIKIHNYNNNSINANATFKFSNNHHVEGTSLDFLLVLIRAFTAIITVPVREVVEKCRELNEDKVNDSDDDDFNYFQKCLGFDVQILLSLLEISEIYLNLLTKDLNNNIKNQKEEKINKNLNDTTEKNDSSQKSNNNSKWLDNVNYKREVLFTCIRDNFFKILFIQCDKIPFAYEFLGKLKPVMDVLLKHYSVEE
ncbi:hypothetical protein HK099_004067 [Clydaea vesicula]|uniref:Transcription factor domain-containing protein n=1 Tax=Clydaea vesicula TaxID=447962 RepID=A0AAD5U5F6_9FUNG|nr:hypothetical protein HK099_004067 [Clydaea vesicula]